MKDDHHSKDKLGELRRVSKDHSHRRERRYSVLSRDGRKSRNLGWDGRKSRNLGWDGR